MRFTCTLGGGRVGHAGLDGSEVGEDGGDVAGEVSGGDTLHPCTASGGERAEAVLDGFQGGDQGVAGVLLTLA